MANKQKKQRQPVEAASGSGWIIRPRYVLLFFLLAFFVLGGVYLSQQTKLKTIEEEKTVLQTQLDSLTVEQERLERMLEYMRTDDYLKQYAREKLGYVYPDDVKFVDDTEQSTSPLSTATPTHLPEATADLLPTPTPKSLTTPKPSPTPTPKPMQTTEPGAEVVTLE